MTERYAGLSRDWLRTLVALLALYAVAAGTAGFAADAPAPVDVDALVERVGEGARIIVIEPAGDDAAEGAAQSLTRTASEQAVLARSRLKEILAQAPAFPDQVMLGITRLAPEGSAWWPLIAFGFGVVFLLIGQVGRSLLNGWGRQHFLHLFDPNPTREIEKIGYLVMRAVMTGVALGLQLGIALMLTFAVFSDAPHMRGLIVQMVSSWGAIGMLSIAWRAVLAPDVPSHRMLNMPDEGARSFHRELMLGATFWVVAIGVCAWLSTLPARPQAHALALIVSFLISVMFIAVVFTRARKTVGAVILGPGAVAQKPAWRRLLAESWHLIAIVYFIAAWVGSVGRLLLNSGDPLAPIGGPFKAVLIGLATYGVGRLIVEAMIRPRDRTASDGKPIHLAIGDGADDGADLDPTAIDRDAALPERPAIRTYADLARHAVSFFAVLVGLGYLTRRWFAGGEDVNATITALWEIGIVGIVAYFFWQSIRIAFDRKIAEEGGFDSAEPGEEGGGAQAASRLATLLPLFRNFVLVFMIAIFAMIALSEMGVDIAPLFAGAGIIGLAIGFGAQTLIRDIFSGVFYLIDDAFRKGEYIDLGGTKGTVERISLRSMQLRHHMGPLHTVPFGEIQQLTNYSRDWVMMKLPLRLTYDTDVEKVRKLVKTIGKELQNDPEIGDKFLQPLKSQGVYKMEDSAMIIRVKFMTRPGEQFVVRKKVYAAIRDAFEREGIRFAHREVTVRLAETPNGRPLSEGETKEIVGAVRPVLDQESATPTASDDGR